jgi:hypothetical protein
MDFEELAYWLAAVAEYNRTPEEAADERPGG